MPHRAASRNTILVLFTAAMIVATIVLSLMTWWKLSRTVQQRSDIRTMLREWERLFSALQDAETGQRGYLITGNESYLEPFNKAAADLPERLSTVVQGAAVEHATDSALRPPQIAEITKLMDQKLAELRESIVVRRREGHEAAAKLMADDRGKLLMDRLRALFLERRTQLDAAIDRISEVMQRDLRWGLYSVFGTSLASLLAGSMAWRFLREAEQRARREERLNAEKRRAEEADREKSTFLATMSHEIRTPMNAILGFGELLQEEVQTDKEKRYAQSIVRSGRSLLQIINDVLDLSKIEAGMLDVRRESTDVRETAAFIQQLFINQAIQKHVEIRTEIAEDVPASLMLDGARLRQILVNLTGNALKFTDQGHVTLRFHGQRGSSNASQYRLIVEVEDTGAGIPADRLKEIFKPFVQVRAARDAELRGTGLGLAIVKRLAELMDGTITVESEVGRGSLFRIMFDGVEISARLAQAELEQEPEVNFNDLRPSHIFVVDDNPTNRELVRGIFEKTHHRISEAADGRQAVESIVQEKPDLVLMDVRMPVLDGRGALEELRQREGFDLLPVIAVTASSMAGEEESLRSSFSGYVRKPYTRAQLFAEMSQFIPRHTVETAPLAATSIAADEPVPESWGQMAAALRELEGSVWLQVRDGMVTSDIQNFAKELSLLAVTHACAPLADYAANLNARADEFAFAEVEQALARFPGLVASLVPSSQSS